MGRLLVERGAVNVNIQNRTGDTPLHIAVANDRQKATTMLLELNGDLTITNHAEMTPIIVGQLAKCKVAIEAMQPFIDQQNKNIEKRKNQLNQYQENRKNTIKQTTNIQNMKNEEYKYDENMMSGKRDVVFKKGFLQK